jgi:DNA-binding protein H-NS
MNLSELSIDELAELRDQVTTKLAESVSDRQRELSGEVERIDALIAPSAKQEPLKTAPAKPRYQKGENSWSGRGTQPAWVKQHLALGGTLAELEGRSS